MSRIDVHRPSAIEPADYEFVAFSYLKIEDLGSAMFLQDERKRLRDHMERSGGKYSSHEHGGNCHVCGSVNMIYSAVFWHAKSGKYIKVGLDCADKLECEDAEAFRKKVVAALEAGKGKRKAKAVLEKIGLGKAWELYVAKASGRNEDIVLDIVERLIKWGDISDKAQNYLSVLIERIEKAPEIAAQRAAEAEAAKPIPAFAGRVSFRGKVVSIKPQGEFDFGPKMLVQHADGWKLWGSVPSALRSEIERGDEVEFMAAIKVSDKDPKFGFISRPSKPRLYKALAA